MHSFKETRVVPYRAELIAQIIMNIEEYPKFLPWCSSASIISGDKKSLIATLEVNFKGFSKSYTSCVTLEENLNSYIVKTEAVSGPFKYLVNNWDVIQLVNGSEINFSIDFEFKSAILDIMVGGIFSIAAKKMIEAFEERAKKLSENCHL